MSCRPHSEIRRWIGITRLVLITALMTLLAASSAPALELRPCGQDVVEVSCARLAVPLDRAAGPSGGELALQVQRWRWGAPLAPPILAMTSGRAADRAEDLLATLDPFLQGQRRDLVVVDARASVVPSCPVVAPPSPAGGATCAQTVGAAAAHLGADEGGQDLEAVRAALGLDRVILYARGFAAPAALQFSAAHPDRVTALVLDAPRGLGFDPLRLDGLRQAMALLADVCRRGCPSRHVAADLRALAARLAADPLAGRAVTPGGRRLAAKLGESDLARILLDAPVERLPEVPAAMVAALHGDAAPALRLREAAAQVLPAPVDVTSACAGGPWPWDPALPAPGRLQALLQGDAATEGFSPGALIGAAPLTQLCAGWPHTSQAAPDVRPPTRTLVLAGDRDRTVPPEAAERVAAALPAARLSILRGREDGALSNAPSSCLSTVLARFLRRLEPPRICDPRRVGLSEERAFARLQLQLPAADRVPPRALADVPAAPGVRGPGGRALTALVWTLQDVANQGARSDAPSGWPGLRGGFTTRRGRDCVLHAVEYVRGIRVSGRLTLCVVGRLDVAGPGAARGALAIDRDLAVSGMLAGRRVRARLSIDDDGQLLLRRARSRKSSGS